MINHGPTMTVQLGFFFYQHQRCLHLLQYLGVRVDDVQKFVDRSRSIFDVLFEIGQIISSRRISY